MRRKILSLVFFFVLTGSSASAQSGGPYTLTWDGVVSGGGASTGGSFTLADTVGLPAAGASRGGSYLLVDGYQSTGGGGEVPAARKTYLPLVLRLQ